MPSQIEMLLRNTSVRIETLDQELLGTGVILPWGERQAVLTCAHLLPPGDNPKDRIKVCFGGERRGVKKLWTPEGIDDFAEAPTRKDIALLTLEAPIPGVEPIAWDPSYPEAGSPVWFHGCRAGQSNTETIRTSVSAWSDEFGCFTLQDAPAKGTSGGPVCVEDGSTVHIVGMVIARLRDTAARGMCLPAAAITDALPGTQALAVVRQSAPPDRPTEIRRRLLEQRGFARVFQLGRLLGHSQRTTVFQGRDIQLDREVAIKVLDPDCSSSERDGFISDVRVAANFDHPNIVRIHGAILGEPLALYVMQYIDGLQLRTILEREEEPIDSNAMIDIIRQIGDALNYMHQRGFVHGNVSDGNIRIDRARVGKMHAVISAFGVTPASNEAEPGARPGMLSDQFFLGRVAHKLIPVAFADRPCPRELAEVVMKMVDLQPAQRYPSVARAMEAFEQAIHRAGLIRIGEAHSPDAGKIAPDPPTPDVVARATSAYERWCRLPRFFDSFYETLFAKDPTIRDRFSPLAREEQPEKLRFALQLVLKFPTQRAGEKPLLAEIAASHSFEGKHNIPPHLYPSFERALLDTATRRDQAFDERDRQAWRAVLSYTFDYMQSRYY
jgi:hemoglobin-like flavoprotein